MIKSKLIWVFFIFFPLHLFTRSIFRTPDSTIPSITIQSSIPNYTNSWLPISHQKNSCTLQNKYLKLKTLKKTFDKKHFEKFLIPNKNIKYRREEKSVASSTLQEQAETCLQELCNNKKEFTYFTILKDRDFSYQTKSGLIILKYKEHPFVLKLFIEHPQTFVRPLQKGFEASCLFILSGSLRHLSGFTRIKNLIHAKKALSKDAQYRYSLDFPRKWFWQPTTQPWLEIEWKDTYNQNFETIKIPSIYGIIADFIKPDNKIMKEEVHTLRQISVDVANFLHYTIDPHVDNFMPEHNSNKIVIIDTEHFPTIAGLDTTMNANGYIQWYFELIGKFLNRQFLRTKQARIIDQCYLL